MKRKITILPLAAILALSLAACGQEVEDFPDYSEIQEQLRELRQERESLERMIREGSMLDPDPVCVLCFEGAYASLMDFAYPMLHEAGLPATVAVREGTLPGQPGMISEKDAETLSAAGWEFIPSGSADIPVSADGRLNPAWTADLDATLAALADLGLPAPAGYAFAPDSYDPLADAALAQRSIPVALHRWSTEKRESGLKALGLTLFGEEIQNSGPVYRIGGATVFAGSSSAQLDVQNACAERAVVAVCTGQILEQVAAADENVNCTVDKFKLVLRDLPAYGQEFGLRVLTFSDACAYKRDFESNLDARKAEYEEFCRKANERIAEIKDETSDLLAQMLK